MASPPGKEPTGASQSIRTRPLLSLSRRALHAGFSSLYNSLTWHQRKKNAPATLAGLTVQTAMEVQHPNVHASTRLLAAHIAEIALRGKTVLDMGCGCGILGLIAARKGANVTAIDINPAAVQLTLRNAGEHGVQDRLQVLESDLFMALDEGLRFDYILFNPPFLEGDARTVREAAFYAGTERKTLIRFFEQAADWLAPDGRVIIILPESVAGSEQESLLAITSLWIVQQTRVSRFFETYVILHLAPEKEIAKEGDSNR